MKTNIFKAISKLKYLALLMVVTLISTEVWGTDYQLITSTSELVAGSKYILGATYSSKAYFASTTSNSNNRKLTAANTPSISGGKVTATDATMVFTLGGSADKWTFYTDNYLGTKGYLNPTSTTGNNYLKVVAELDKYAYFTISITSAGVATITCNGKTSRHKMYLNGTTCISCYNNQTGAQYVELGIYKEVTTSCTTAPTVTAGSNSAVASTTATVTCASGISSLGSAGCSITSYGFVISTSSNPTIGGSGVTKHEVGTTYTTTGTAFTKNLTGLTAGTTYYVKPYATNGYGSAYGAQTSFTTTAACANTVTINKGTATKCTFTLSVSGAQASCSGVSTTVTVTPNTGYATSSVTQSGASAAPTISGSGNTRTVTYAANTTGTSTINVTCTAQSYTVTLNKNSGTGGTASVSATYDATCPTIASAPTRTGYDFTGYYSGSGGTGTKVVNSDLTWVATASGYTSSGKWVKAATTTLYAGWTAKTYTVTWKVNGVAYSTGSQSTSVNHGEHVTKLPTDPSPASYCGDKFMGWTTVENYDAGTAPSPLFTTASEAPTASGNQVFYAVFGYY